MRIAVLTGLLVGATAMVAEISAAAARPHTLTVCHGYSCHYKTRLELGSGGMARLATLLRAGAGSPEAERRAIARAVQYYEQRASAAIGVRDRPKSDFNKGGEPGQMDCVDESTNTTSLLRLMAANDMLKHHKVRQRVSRGFFLDKRYPHFTAVIVDKAGQQWAVDSWYEPAGGPPDVMPLSRWRQRGVMGVR